MPKRLAIVGPHEAALLDYEDAPLQPNQVKVQTEYASGKHGTTFGMLDGSAFTGYNFDPELRLFVEGTNWQTPPSPENPRAFGTTGVGTIVQIGESVTRWKVGDRVFGLFDIRETNIKVEDAYLYPLDTIDPLTALLVEPAYVSFHCIRESNVRFGESVAVIGLGALGCLAVEMARNSGAEAIFAVDTLEKRRNWAAANGATAVFDPTRDDVALEIHRQTGGKGVDVAIELTGVYPGLFLATRCVRVAGLVCSAGFYQGEARGMWLGREWHHNRLTAIVPHGCGFGHPPRDYPRWDERRAYEAIVSLMRQGKLVGKGLIDPVAPFAEGPSVFEMIQQRPQDTIKFGIKF